jgi:nitrogen regulatory protein PII
MKALFISYNQAMTERIAAMLDEVGIRGYTLFPLTHGRGSYTGEPHMASHTWPAMNSTIIAMVEDEKIAPAMAALREIDKDTQLQGLRAFVWNIEEQM